jgi:hypothetical protein
VVPSLEQVGLLRQTTRGEPEVGQILLGGILERGQDGEKGDRVAVVIGDFRVDGLMVESIR